MKERILFRDKAGNTLVDDGKRLGVRNKQGKLVTYRQFKNFILKNKLFVRKSDWTKNTG